MGQKFEEFEYRRPDMANWKAEFQDGLNRFKQATSFDEQLTAMDRINQLRRNISTMEALCYVRHSIDTEDSFYKGEQDFFDEVTPEIQEMVTSFYQALVKATFRSQLEEKYGKQLFALAEAQLKTFSPEIMTLMREENKLTSEYAKLVASAKIPFDGEERTLAQLLPYMESESRKVRKEASDAHYQFFADHLEQFDQIYDRLVKMRTEMAQKLGFKNFVELGYYRMSRTDYNAEMVANYRKQVRELIVPIVSSLYERQAKRIGVAPLYFYDEGYRFKTGNPVPKGSPEWIIENGAKMYQELSPETDEFFQLMLGSNLVDLVAKKGKMFGGYCISLDDFGVPFIFSNFNGTSDDIDVLTHEVGHAFQNYLSRHYRIPEYNWPTMDACEIHSMSMEFFAWPWMEKFFKEDEEKYYFHHLTAGLRFLPYGVMVDEFQHLVYENPDWTPEKRRAVWHDLEKVYLPHRNYDDNDYLNSGGFWQRQTHIYQAPFYYIDYTLAQVCAFQFWKKMHEDRESAWDDYVKLCKLGGSKSFVELVKEVNLISPFEDGCIASVVDDLQAWLDKVDDGKL